MHRAAVYKLCGLCNVLQNCGWTPEVLASNRFGIWILDLIWHLSFGI